MSTGLIIVIVVVVIVVVALAAMAAMRPQQRNRKLRQQFGPEYERELAQHNGDTKATDQVLEQRTKRAKDLDVRPLDAAQRERALAQWTTLQEQFVDSPAKAVIDADHLLDEVLRDRGFPAGGANGSGGTDGTDEDRYAVLSVHNAAALPGYRSARQAAERAQRGEATTEELRQAFVNARETLDHLIGGGASATTSPTSSNERTA
ncbi:hypothetical protein [Streptacidiphilus carbonis]|uniref:hypothetical protein n=1 Tax=Streptacidiphilus carbonis TaxID=105422 RepID=UPI0005AAAC4A|nr:hypothetical protein [Streptacidiphilus carbonis]